VSPEAHAEAEVLESHAPTPITGKLSVSLVTPRGSLLAHEADEVIAPGADGEFGVLAGHIPFLSALKPGVLVVRSGTQREVFAVGAGYLEVGAGGTTQVLVEQASRPEDIDLEEARAEKAKLDAELKELAGRGGVEASAVARLTAQAAWAQARIDAAAAK
jgi:F-type H+-transporting ATPase subunit epsilon